MVSINVEVVPRNNFELVRLTEYRHWISAFLHDNCISITLHDIGDLPEDLELIEKLSEQIRHLTMLRLLDLTDCSKLSYIPPKVMSSLTKLEALYMGNTSVQWQVERSNIERSNVSIDELKHLQYLTILEIQIPDGKMSKGLLSPQLERYKIFIGSYEWQWNFHSKTSRMLKLKLDTNEGGIISQLKEIRELELLEVSGVRNVLYDLDRNGFSELKHLSVKDNSHLLCIVDSKHSVSCDALPSLESLILLHLNGLENICNGPLGAQFFRRLRSIKVQSCNKLNNIFSFTTDKVLPHLQEIRVSYCNYMEEIFAIGGQDEANNSELVHETIKFSQLCIRKLDTLPRLKSFYCKVKTTSPLRLTSDTNAREIISEEELDIPPSLFNEKVSFPNLENLEIYNINVEKIWHNQFPTMSCVQNLTRLIVNVCGNLKELFSSSMVNSFVQLQYLQICKCPRLEKMVVITEKLKEGEKRDKFSFRQLNHLIIMDLEKLRRLCYGNYIEFPSLKEMRIESCPQLKEFIFDDKVGFPSLEEMKISLMTNLKMIWHNQVAEVSFCKLKSLEVKYCQKLLTVLPSNMFGSLLSLESLHVSECASVEEIFDLQGIKLFEERESIAATQSRELCNTYDPQIMICFANLQKLKVSECQSIENLFSENLKVAMEEANARLVFPKLTFLELDELPKLRTSYPGRHTVEGPVLKELKLQRCGIYDPDEEGQIQQPHFLETLDVYEIHVEKIWYNLRPIISSSVENLTKLVVYDCGNLKELFSSSMVVTKGLRKKERRNTMSFPKLNYLEMKYLAKLTKLCLGYYIEFPSLKEFTIHECPESKAFIFDDKVRYCQKLFSVLPSNMFGRFSSLESLYVTDCGSLEEIFDLQGINYEERHSIAATQSRDPQIMLSFANLQNFEVSYCQSLKNLFSVSMVAKEEPPARFLFPKLSTLKLHELPDLCVLNPSRHTVVGPVLKRLELRHCGEESQMQQPLFLVEEAFPCLEELNLAGKNAMIMWQSQVSECFFHKLKILEVANDESTVLPLSIIQRFPNLEMLSLEESSYEEIFLYKDVQGTPAKMKKLVLYILKDLKYIWKQDSRLDLILQNLEVLRVGSCDSLINLLPPSASFQNLTILEVVSCSSLKYMGTSSTAKSLVQLIKMSISYCEKMTEVVGNQGDLMEDKIIFSNLKKELEVFKSPDIKIFSRGDLTTQILREVKIDEKSVELYHYADLNKAIQQFHGKANDKFP
ncbi:hypothetical protein Ddye_022500 [Dipteronia dyeriana]|uniref:Disease resistance protein At4g27190-like leucine-rich repeats domain-containing protein n=1 Tax=Dipteronia dyeriana TaxID=168575 RepID=A0AAD9TRN7_9ROSI|nr:hypothetical protein Ddye_022500 [Dipteronia dyeriana]